MQGSNGSAACVHRSAEAPKSCERCRFRKRSTSALSALSMMATMLDSEHGWETGRDRLKSVRVGCTSHPVPPQGDSPTSCLVRQGCSINQVRCGGASPAMHRQTAPEKEGDDVQVVVATGPESTTTMLSMSMSVSLCETTATLESPVNNHSTYSLAVLVAMHPDSRPVWN